MLENSNTRVIYYIPDIPDNISTTRFNHALGIGKNFKATNLVTHIKPPTQIIDHFQNTHVIGEVNSLQDVVINSMKAYKIINSYENPTIVTSFHYSPVFAGYLSSWKGTWIIDVYDDPAQMYLRRNGFSAHKYATKMICSLSSRSDLVIYTLHPDFTPIGTHRKKYLINGSPINQVENNNKPPRCPLKCIWVGKTRLDDGLKAAVDTISGIDDVVLDIFGKNHDETAKYINKKRTNNIILHGSVDHSEIINHIENHAHVGLCTLSNYKDYRQSYPIKVSEYLAGGLIPILSNFPGMRYQAKNAGIYIDNNKELEKSIKGVLHLSNSQYCSLSQRARKRAQEISWTEIRKEFVKLI